MTSQMTIGKKLFLSFGAAPALTLGVGFVAFRCNPAGEIQCSEEKRVS